jgi:hypothetical protein
MSYQWREGAPLPRGPKGVLPVEDVKAAIDALEEPSPENLFEASKSERHILHHEIWSEGDQAWANRARMQRCREIVASVHEVLVIGGKNVGIRAFECVKVKGTRRWASIANIVSDDAMRKGYIAEIRELQEQALAKTMRYEEYLGSLE